jgi:hypothetical protein
VCQVFLRKSWRHADRVYQRGQVRQLKCNDGDV